MKFISIKNTKLNNMKSFKRFVYLFIILLVLQPFLGCNSGNNENPVLDLTIMDIEDPYRKYFPIMQGQKLNIVVRIDNKGDRPLKIFNVLPSCGCTIAKYPKAIAPGGFGILNLEYNSIKNIGYVNIFTTIVANTKQRSHDFYFETNVVPNALYTPDYEELYYLQQLEEKSLAQEYVDGGTNQKGYIVDSTFVRKFK